MKNIFKTCRQNGEKNPNVLGDNEFLMRVSKLKHLGIGARFQKTYWIRFTKSLSEWPLTFR